MNLPFTFFTFVVLSCCSEKQTSVHSDHQQHYYHSRAPQVFSGNSQPHSSDVNGPATHAPKQCSGYSGRSCGDNSGHSHANCNVACLMATRGQHMNDTFPPRHYNAYAYQDSLSLHSKGSAVEATPTRRLDSDFRQASREHDGSPISSSSAASTQPLDFTLGSKDGSSSGDKDTIQMTASNDELDVSLEHETTTGYGHQRACSPQYRQQQGYYGAATDLAGHPHEMMRAAPVTPSRSRSVETLDRVHVNSEARHSVPSRRLGHVSRSQDERHAYKGVEEASGTCKRERAAPINSARLRAIRQRTRNAVVGLDRTEIIRLLQLYFYAFLSD